MQNLNDKYIEDFNTALNIYENEYPHNDLINFLKNGTTAQKQAAALKLDKIGNQAEADILMQNLTGCDGKIREAVSFRLSEFVAQNPENFIKYADIFIEAVIDINGNICRNTIFALNYLKKYPQFCDEFCEKLTRKTLKLAKTARTFSLQDGKYKINKEIFKLYWYLETIYHFAECVDLSMLLKIINETKGIIDYTIREKTAKILTKFDKIKEFDEIKTELKKDENYYVRRV